MRVKNLIILGILVIGIVLCNTGSPVSKTTVTTEYIQKKVGYDIIPTTTNVKLIQYIEAMCIQNAINPIVIFSIIKVESGWNQAAHSSTHDSGLMQLSAKYVPYFIKTYGDLNKKYDPVKSSFDNVELGIKHFKSLLSLYGGNYIRAIVAYNTGTTSVKTNKIPQSSLIYLEKVLSNLPEQTLKNILGKSY